jgi:Uma2 family endonuclease
MAEAARAQTLYDAIRALPEGVTGEIINGQLYAHPRPTAIHADIALSLGAALKTSFDRRRRGRGGWRILPEPEVHFRRDREVLVPDLVGWRRERLPELPDDQRFEVVPDWVCEVLSPSTASNDREVKMPVYARYGVGHAWIVDPRARTVEAYARDGASWSHVATAAGEARIALPPFDDVALPPPWDN